MIGLPLQLAKNKRYGSLSLADDALVGWVHRQLDDRAARPWPCPLPFCGLSRKLFIRRGRFHRLGWFYARVKRRVGNWHMGLTFSGQTPLGSWPNGQSTEYHSAHTERRSPAGVFPRVESRSCVPCAPFRERLCSRPRPGGPPWKSLSAIPQDSPPYTFSVPPLGTVGGPRLAAGDRARRGCIHRKSMQYLSGRLEHPRPSIAKGESAWRRNP